MNYHTLSLEKTKEFIKIVNEFPLLKEEKFKIINYKPNDLLELSLVSIIVVYYCFILLISLLEEAWISSIKNS